MILPIVMSVEEKSIGTFEIGKMGLEIGNKELANEIIIVRPENFSDATAITQTRIRIAEALKTKRYAFAKLSTQ